MARAKLNALDVTRDPKTFTRDELEAGRITDVRVIARNLFGSGTWLAHTNKEGLINSIVTLKTPDGEGPEHDGDGGDIPTRRALEVKLKGSDRQVTMEDIIRGIIQNELADVKQEILSNVESHIADRFRSAFAGD
jgi:hypothetical protein